jgi:L-lactate dehydrogenase complex protein LldF
VSVDPGGRVRLPVVAPPPAPGGVGQRHGGRGFPEVADWAGLRDAGAAIKAASMARLDELLVELETRVVAAGGQVHWARDATEATTIVTELVRATGEREVVKVKSMATQEIGLNEALAAAGITAVETDLAELIVQLADDTPSHILVPAIHRNRAEIRALFTAALPGVDAELSDDPRALAAAARAHLRARFLTAKVAISGANAAVAQTGTVCVVESEGNGRMCLTLPDTLITVMGIEKVVPTPADLAVLLELLARSATGERMNPYTSLWTGVHRSDGPRSFHLVLLDNGRTATLADPHGRAALHCIRCSACLNVCPVYTRTGGHAYGSVDPGPIGAILTPQLAGIATAPTLPYASTLCGACADVCPVKIPIPRILVHLRAAAVDHHRTRRRLPTPEALTMAATAWTMTHPARFAHAQTTTRAARWLDHLPGPLTAWTTTRDLPTPPTETFRRWWARTRTPTPRPPTRPTPPAPRP